MFSGQMIVGQVGLNKVKTGFSNAGHGSAYGILILT